MTEKTKADPAVEQTLEVPAINPALDSAAEPPTPPAATYPLLHLDPPAEPPPARPPAEPPPTLETPALSDNPALKSLARRKKPQ